jgi:hypothetical protein
MHQSAPMLWCKKNEINRNDKKENAYFYSLLEAEEWVGRLLLFNYTVRYFYNENTVTFP